MSTLKVNTIQNTSAAHSSTPEEIAQGRAKAWINYNGGRNGSFAIRDSFGVSSITDNSAGDHDINWSTSFTDDGYSVVSGGNFADDDGGGRVFTSVRTQTTSKIQLITIGDGGGFYDSQRTFAAAFGDQ